MASFVTGIYDLAAGDPAAKEQDQFGALAGTAAYTFPTAFSVTPDYFIGVTATGATVSAISMTAATVTGSASTGTIVLEGC